MTTGPGRSWKWWVCGVLLLATMLNYMDRLTLAVTATTLKTTIHLDDARYGRLERWFSYAFAIGGILFGVVADRVGPRRLYPVVFAGWSVAGLVTPLAGWRLVTDALGDPGDAGSGEFCWLMVCRTLLGFFESGHWPCALLTARNVLAENDRPLGNSILQSGASFGAVLTPLVVEGFRIFGAPWQTPFVVIGAAGLLWVPLWYQLTRSGLVDAGPTARSELAARPASGFSRVALLFALSAVIVITISLTWQLHRAWQLKYLKEHRGYVESPGELSIANVFASIYYLVAGAGCVASGTLVSVQTKWGVSIGPARLLSFAGCTALMAFSVAVPNIQNGVWLFAALLAVGVGSLAAHPLYYSLVQELPTRHMGVLSGFLSALSWVAVGFMQGRMGEYVEQTRSYDLPLVATGLAPLAGLIAFLVWVRATKRAGENGR